MTTPPQDSPPSGSTLERQGWFWVCVRLWAITLPLFLIAMLSWADRNAYSALEGFEEGAAFRLLLNRSIDADGARILAAQVTSSGNWRRSRVISGRDTLDGIEELQSWIRNPENREFTNRLPYTIELIPLNILSPRVNPANLARDLRDLREVEEVFYDSEGVRWMRLAAARWRRAIRLLRTIFIILTILGAYIALRIGTPAEPLKSSRNIPLLACGVIAVAATGLIHCIARFATGLPLLFIGPTEGLGLMAGGAMLGLLSTCQVAIPGIRSVTMIALAIVLLVSASAPAAPLPRPALPPQEVAVSPSISGADSDERMLRLESITLSIAEREEAIAYLEDYLRRSEEERLLDSRNLHSLQIQTDLAMLSSAYTQSALNEHRLASEQFCLALGRMGTPSLMPAVMGNPGFRSKNEIATRIVRDKAKEALFLLDIDRRELQRSETTARQLREELRRVEFFAARSNQSPEAILAEKRRLEQERVNLIQRRGLIESAPADAPPEDIEPTEETRVALSTSLLPLREPADSQRQDFSMIYSSPLGTLIHAVRGGTVLYASRFVGLGNTVIIEHENGFSTLYGFLSEIAVEQGQVIRTGDYVGAAGITKPQNIAGIRFEVRKDGRMTRPETLGGLNAQRVESLLGGSMAP